MHMMNLSHVPLETLRMTFEEAFSDYELPVRIPMESFREMMRGRDLKTERSIGCFDDDRLVGFILCGYREDANGPILYDGGTGVVPSHRGKHLASDMLGQLLRECRVQHIRRFVLEVLEHNVKAQALYEKAGFAKNRFLRCFRTDKSLVPYASAQSCCHLEPLDRSTYANTDHRSVTSFIPSWQNDVSSVLNNWEQYAGLSVMRDGNIVGYGLVHRIKGDIPQLAVSDDADASCMFALLVHTLCCLTEARTLSMLNVEAGSTLDRLLEKAGWENHVNQHEMLWEDRT